MVLPGGVQLVALKKVLTKDISGIKFARLCNYGDIWDEGSGLEFLFFSICMFSLGDLIAMLIAQIIYYI